jgi:DDE superfamily endonuclease
MTGSLSTSMQDLLDLSMTFAAYGLLTYTIIGGNTLNVTIWTVQEYLLGDPGYMGAEMFILRRVDGREVIEEGSAVADAFNKRHASRRVKVEWGIGGLKNRFRKFLTVCSNRRYKFRAIFESCCRLTNFVHRRHLDFRTEDLGSQAGTAEDEEIFASEWA